MGLWRYMSLTDCTNKITIFALLFDDGYALEIR